MPFGFLNINKNLNKINIHRENQIPHRRRLETFILHTHTNHNQLNKTGTIVVLLTHISACFNNIRTMI